MGVLNIMTLTLSRVCLCFMCASIHNVAFGREEEFKHVRIFPPRSGKYGVYVAYYRQQVVTKPSKLDRTWYT